MIESLDLNSIGQDRDAHRIEGGSMKARLEKDDIGATERLLKLLK